MSRAKTSQLEVISIVVPSLASIEKLRILLHSLAWQKSATYEVLICSTGTSPDFISQIAREFPEARVLNSPENCISHARNLGLRNAIGDLVLFLDDDCSLPRDNYLSDLSVAFRENPNLCGGGFYLTESNKLNFFSRFYNFFCNFWLHSHLSEKMKPQVLLGGCSFYAKSLLLENGLGFSAHYLKSGEEYGLNRALLQRGHSLSLQSRWSVYHNPDCGPKSLFKKSWVQGQSLDEKRQTPFSSHRGWVRFLLHRPLESLKALPLLGVYFLVGRVSYWTTRRARTERPDQNLSHSP